MKIKEASRLMFQLKQEYRMAKKAGEYYRADQLKHRIKKLKKYFRGLKRKKL